MTNTQAIWRLFRELRELRWYLILLIILGVLVTLLEGVGLFLLMPIFATLIGMSGDSDMTELTGYSFLDDLLGSLADDTRLTTLILVVMTLIILKNIAQYIDAVGWTWYDALVNKRIQAKLFARLMANDPRDTLRGPGRLLNT
ncbi:MAG: hypothetical protein AAGL23_08950, partial [Pseudomonadota bacterium]